MGRDVSILKHFPAFMRTDHTGKVMGEISAVLGGNLDECERRMADILRSHRLFLARHAADLHRLSALLGLTSADFAIVQNFYLSHVFGPRDHTGYKAYLSVLRTLVQRTVKVFADGCGTIWSLLEGTCILLAAETLFTEENTPALEHPDDDIWIDDTYRGGFIHRLAVKYKTMADETLVDRSGYLYLVENPVMEKSSAIKDRRQRERFPITKNGFFDTRIAIKIVGIQNRTVFPQIINLTTHQGIGFNGTIMEGQTLLFTREGKAYLNGLDVTDRCYTFEGALFDEEKVVVTPDDLFVVVAPEGALHRKFPRPVILPLIELKMPRIPLGDSTWQFSVKEGVFDGDAFNRCVFSLPTDVVELNALPASGKVELLWEEHELYAVTILIPDDLTALDEYLESVDLTAWIRAGLERFRGAGIRVNVAYYSDDWIINHSVLRETTALTGKGIFFDGTVL
ncbi:hypothetical protein [Desulfobacula sp.]|uniref:hypothetical protein n=1 Tax=Desulfobacula sp. TaxID=2593537 RepID=UPI0026181D20|nr:hypothetical protein [Desulfobacula sp.]